MAEVVSINGHPIMGDEAHAIPEVVATLEQLLKDARAGEIRAIAIARVNPGQTVGSLWARPSNGDHGHDLAAAIGYLDHRYKAVMVGVAVATGP